MEMGGMAKSSVEIKTGEAMLDKSGICYIVKELVGFVLYMHQQIPHTLQQLETGFDGMKLEHERLVGKSTETEAQLKPSSQRILMGKLREIKRRFKKFEKLMSSISNLLSAVQTIVHSLPEVRVVLLALGASSTRPRHVYEIYFVCEESVPEDVETFPQMGRKVKADVLSKKIIRALVSNGAGCADSYSAPTKLFLLIQAPANVSLPQDFLPRRDYAYSKKVDPCRIHVMSSYGNGKQERSNKFNHADSSIDPDPPNVKNHMHDIIWFQCTHNVQGLAYPGNQY